MTCPDQFAGAGNMMTPTIHQFHRGGEGDARQPSPKNA